MLNAGHWVMIEQPDATNKILEESAVQVARLEQLKIWETTSKAAATYA